MGKSKVSTGASEAVGSPSRLTILTQPAQGEGWWMGTWCFPSAQVTHMASHALYPPMHKAPTPGALTVKADQNCVPVHLDHLLGRAWESLCRQRKETQPG